MRYIFMLCMVCVIGTDAFSSHSSKEDLSEEEFLRRYSMTYEGPSYSSLLEAGLASQKRYQNMTPEERKIEDAKYIIRGDSYHDILMGRCYREIDVVREGRAKRGNVDQNREK
ncbi:MAG: hypothetical protein GY915_07125 [bacterium]|nr:hypothetical protein [bacterium]